MKSKEERLAEICSLIKNASTPLSIKELVAETGLQRSTLIPYLKILEELQEICKLEESSTDRFQRLRNEELHPYLGRKRKLYKSK